ncbi:MAG: hypothetical protein IKY76_00370 [Alistipes sp.]|nr:hypothetical protein [Alistipes sp.]
MRKILFLAFVALSFCSCKDNIDNKLVGSWASKHFITEYLVASEIAVDNVSGTLCLEVSGEEYSVFNGEDKAMELTNLYNDNAFKGGVYPGLHPALAYPIDKITICANKDFDAEHPVGEPLDDIARLGFNSFYPFIANGYEYFPTSEEWWYPDRLPYSIPFADINAEVTKLIEAYFTTWQISPSYVAKIEFASQPEKAGEYTFTIEMTTNGETFETTFTHTFE